MALISLQEIKLAFGGPLIFDKLNLQVQPGERIALLGRNGAGKTTLMKVLVGELKIHEGLVVVQKGIRVVYLAQEVSSDIKGSVFDVVLSGLGKSAKLLSDYHHLITRLEKEHTPELMRQLDTLQSELDRTDSWEINKKAEDIIKHMKLDSENDFEKLSGGQKRRTLLTRVLILKPDVLLLDEPTNHLDIESIKWLEEFLKGYPGTIFFVTHDRMFMTHLATRIIELDRGKIYNWKCNYKIFLERKQAVLDNEASEWNKFDKKLTDHLKIIEQKAGDSVTALDQKLSNQVSKIEKSSGEHLKSLDLKVSDQINLFEKNSTEEINKTNQKIEDIANLFDTELNDKFNSLNQKLEDQNKIITTEFTNKFTILDKKLNSQRTNFQNKTKTLVDTIKALNNDFSSKLQIMRDEFNTKENVLREMFKKFALETEEYQNNLKPTLESIKSQQDLVKITVDVQKKQIRESAKEWITNEMKLALKNKEREILLNIWIDELKEIFMNFDKLKETNPKDLKIHIKEISTTIESFRQKFVK